MKKGITVAEIALLLAFAAPAPPAETPAGLDPETLVELSRPARIGARIAFVTPFRPSAPPPAATRPTLDAGLPAHPRTKAAPRILSRPPPL